MSNGLLYIAGLLTLVLAALFAVPYFVDWNGYRGVFEEEATRILGREVRVGGDVNVRLLPAPYVRFEKLRIADPDGTTGEPFFSARNFTMKLSVPPLLKGVIEANEIELKRPILRLALDQDGGGNWRSLSITPGTLPFVPSDVTLQSVKIKDGMVKLQGPKGIGFAELDGLNGELKADSIEGPFSFKGTFGWKGSPRELRFATGVTEADGSLRFKAIVRGTKQTNVYNVDGRIADLKGQPRIDGDITAKLELDGAEEGAHEGVLQQLAGAEQPRVDFKSSFAGDAAGLRLDGITLSFERVGQPQLITGAATASFENALSVDLKLASRWLDLDRIASAGETDSPFDISRDFVAAVMDALPTKANTQVRFDLDQATLGGEPVSDVSIEVARDKGGLLLKELRAALPGGTKLALYGTLADTAAGPGGHAFEGELALRGTSLARFLTWAAKDNSVVEAMRSDGPYALQGRLGMSAGIVDLTQAGAEIGGKQVSGEVHYRGGERTRVGVVLDGQEIDAGQLWPVGVSYVKSLLMGGDALANAGESSEGGGADGTSGAAKRPRWLDAKTTDLSLRLRAGQLLTGQQQLRDVDMDIAVENGKLAMRACKFATDDGLKVELDGDVADVTGEPRGALRWVFSAPGKEAFTSLVRLWDLPQDASTRAMSYVGLTPMRLAGTVRLGERGKTAADVTADGSVQGGRIEVSALLDGGLGGWRSGLSDVAVTIDSPDVVGAFDAVTMRSRQERTKPRALDGEIFLKAVGVPAKGLLTTATVKAPGLFFAYDGDMALPAAGETKFDGDVRVSSREVGDILALAGLGNGGTLRGVPIIGTIKMASASHAIELKPQQLAVAESKLDGTIAVAYPNEGPAIVTAQLSVDKASIPGLLSGVLDRGATAAVEADAADAQVADQAPEQAQALGKSIWPESAFDFAALQGVEGKLGIAIGSLMLEPGMALKNAQLDVTLAGDKLEISKLAGDALGGKLQAAVTLERAPGGANLAGDIRLQGAHLQSPTRAGQPGDGAATLSLQLSGRGATPGGLIAVATGKGELELGDTTMHVPTPLAVVSTSEAVLTGAAGGSGEELVTALREKIGQNAVQVGPRKIPIEIADGAARLAAFTLPSEAGTTTVTTTVDLSTLMVDSAWDLQPKAPDIPQPDKPRGGALPSVNVVYVGPLKDAWSLEPRISAEPLERELAIRKMEFDADQLERLHQLDAERARRDAQQGTAAAPGPAGPQQQPAAPQAPPPAVAGPSPAQSQRVQPPAQVVPQSNSEPQPLMPVPLGDGGAAGIEAPAGASVGAGVQVPSLESRIPSLQETGDPYSPADGSAAPDGTTAQAEPQSASRPRRSVRRQVPAGEQVLRALQNGIP